MLNCCYHLKVDYFPGTDLFRLYYNSLPAIIFVLFINKITHNFIHLSRRNVPYIQCSSYIPSPGFCSLSLFKWIRQKSVGVLLKQEAALALAAELTWVLCVSAAAGESWGQARRAGQGWGHAAAWGPTPSHPVPAPAAPGHAGCQQGGALGALQEHGTCRISALIGEENVWIFQPKIFPCKKHQLLSPEDCWIDLIYLLYLIKLINRA